MKYKITLVVEGGEYLQKSLKSGLFKQAISEDILEAREGEKLLSFDYTEHTEREPGQHRFADCGGSPRCVTCGCDEDDAFVGGEDCTFGFCGQDEQQRRDEKNGLYGDKVDVAN